MKQSEIDHGLDALLELDGMVFVIDPDGGYWVKFVVRRVKASPERPHGLNYSLTLHTADGERLIGFDNAHAVSEKRGVSRIKSATHDHQHALRTIKSYEYADAATLLSDFWKEVDSILKQKGITS